MIVVGSSQGFDQPDEQAGLCSDLAHQAEISF